MRILVAEQQEWGRSDYVDWTAGLVSALDALAAHRQVIMERLSVPAIEPSSSTDSASHGSAWAAIDDESLADYRHSSREALEAAVHEFSPDLIHVVGLGPLAHLALETGVPYVVTIADADLGAVEADARYRSLAEDAAAAAGQLVVPSAVTAERAKLVLAAADIEAEILVAAAHDSATLAATLLAVYNAVLERRGLRANGRTDS